MFVFRQVNSFVKLLNMIHYQIASKHCVLRILLQNYEYSAPCLSFCDMNENKHTNELSMMIERERQREYQSVSLA